MQTLFYFPTTVLFIDDDPAFLSTVGFEIDNKIPLQFCKTSREVFPLLEGRPTIKDLIKKIMTHWHNTEADLPTDWIMRAALRQLHEELYNPHRFSYISAIVVDYSMPGLNGAKLCELLKDNPIKKIMLTGHADYNTAVQLFNLRLIDHFIVKDTAQMAGQLNDCIRKAQFDYFSQASSSFIPSMLKEFFWLNEAFYWQFVNTLFHEKNFSEYYLLDDSGSLLFLDYLGRPTWMAMKSAHEVENFYDIAMDHGASAEVIQSLKNKEKIPFFFTEQDQKVSVSQWDRYLHRANFFPGLDDFSYALISDHQSYGLDQKKIISHKYFLENKISELI